MHSTRCVLWMVFGCLLAACSQADPSTGTGAPTATLGQFVTAEPMVMPTKPPLHVFPKVGTTLTVDLDHVHYRSTLELKVGDTIRIVHPGTTADHTYLIRLNGAIVQRDDGRRTDRLNEAREPYPVEGWTLTATDVGEALIQVAFFAPPHIVCADCPTEYVESFNYKVLVTR